MKNPICKECHQEITLDQKAYFANGIGAWHHACPEYAGENAKLNEIMAGLLRRRAIAVEKLTEQQLAVALRQAIACGDFTRRITIGSGNQQVVYTPFARERELLSEITKLKQFILESGLKLPGAFCEYEQSY